MLYFIEYNTKTRVIIDPQHVVSIVEDEILNKPKSVLDSTGEKMYVARIMMSNCHGFTVEDPGRGTNTSVLQQIEQAKRKST